MTDPAALAAMLADRTLQLTIALEALGERDQREAEQGEWGFALQLQTGSLPNEFPAFPDRPEFDIRGGMVTAFQVGGDVYDFWLLDERRLAFVVADASGKGLPAAIFVTRMRTLLRAACRRIAEPGRCMAAVNEMLCLHNPGLMFVTAFYGVLDTGTGTVSFANAGHNPPVHVRTDGAEPVAHEAGLVLGVEQGSVYTTSTLTLCPGETLCCFSDGVTEAHDVTGALFGDARTEAALATRSSAPLAEMEAALLAAVDGFIGTAAIADDLTLLMLRWNGPTAP